MRPPPVPLSAKNRSSFAFPTLKERVPVIICKVIDLLHRGRRSHDLQNDLESVKQVVEAMAKLRYEVQTNKPLRPLEDGLPDVDVWTEYLSRLASEATEVDGQPLWFDTRWLSAECYAYRRLYEAFQLSSGLRDYDYFGGQKREAFYGSLQATKTLLEAMEVHKEAVSEASALSALLQMSLWGNKCDLSISAGTAKHFESEDPLSQVTTLEANLLVNNTVEVCDHLLHGPKSGGATVDLVLDNAGFELITDLCLADYMTRTGLAKRIRLRVKDRPWFVSDTTSGDIDWMLKEMAQGAVNSLQPPPPVQDDENHKDLLEKYSQKWSSYLDSGVWTVHADQFWTYPHDYSLMRSEEPDLYRSLGEATLIVFKGDLNYRKLVGDLGWNPTDTFETALQNFHPAPLVSLRTLKADVVAGLADGQAEVVAKKDPDWMINGDWGTIQFCNRTEII